MMKKLATGLFLLVALVALPMVPAIAANDGGGPPTGGQGNDGGPAPESDPGTSIRLVNPLGIQGGPTSLNELLNRILDFVIRIGSIVVVVMLVYVGYLFVAAQGKPEDISKARSALLWTIIGALILLGSKVIAVGIQATVEALSVGN